MAASGFRAKRSSRTVKIGNPLSDGTWTYTWQNGRQLAGMSKSGTTVSFKYNASGMRTRKIVNGVMTKYTLHGKNVVHMTRGNDNLHFFYDVQNRPAVVVYNGTAYAYVKNLQGDIIAILDNTGTAVVSYTYDAWGTPTGTTGTMAETLGKSNPFRYRGYVYDEETGLYYLRSRYYNPAWCRFLNADALLGDGGLLSHNLFTYCKNSICNRVDIAGTEDWECPECKTTGALYMSVVMTRDQMLDYIRTMHSIYPSEGTDTVADNVQEKVMSLAEDIPMVGWLIELFNFGMTNSEREKKSGYAYVTQLYMNYDLYENYIKSFTIDVFVTRREFKVTAYYIELNNDQETIVQKNNAYTMYDEMSPLVFNTILNILKEKFNGMKTHTHPDHNDTYDSYVNRE